MRRRKHLCLAQLWEHVESLGHSTQVTLWIKELLDVPSAYGWVAGMPAMTEVLFKRENILPSCIRLDGLHCVLGKTAPAWALFDLISKCKCAVICGLSPVPSILREKASLQWCLERINKNSNLKCWSSPLGEAQWWEEEGLLAGESFGQQGEFLSTITSSSRRK